MLLSWTVKQQPAELNVREEAKPKTRSGLNVTTDEDARNIKQSLVSLTRACHTRERGNKYGTKNWPRAVQNSSTAPMSQKDQ